MASFLLLGSVANRGIAGSIVVGSTGGNNVFPLGINSYQGEYQQLYANKTASPER